MEEESEEITIIKRNRKTSLDWTSAQCFQLISYVKNSPCIWDITSTYYKERSRREIVWKNIAEKLKLPQNEIVAKWALLRQQFRNNHSKSQKSSCNPGSKKRKNANEFHEAMLFLAPILAIQAHMRENNLDEPPPSLKLQHKNEDIFINDPLRDTENQNCKIETDPEEETEEEPEADYQECDEDFEEDPSWFLQPELPIPSKLKKSETKMDREVSLEYSNLLKNAIEALQSKDEDQFEIWGRSIAATIRNYPDPMAVRRFKAAVSINLAKLESGQYDSENDEIKVSKSLERRGNSYRKY